MKASTILINKKLFVFLIIFDLAGWKPRRTFENKVCYRYSTFLRYLYIHIYLLVVSSPCSTHSGLECNLLCHWSDGISQFRSFTQRQLHLSTLTLVYLGPSTLKVMMFFCPCLLSI